MAPSATGGSADRPSTNTPLRALWPFQHARLVTFFAGLAATGTLLGTAALQRLGPAPDPAETQ